MSEEGLANVLCQLGLSKRETDVYIFLSKNGPQTVGAASARLKIERVQTYRTLKSLQEKGIIEATLEAPTRFAAISFESLLDTLIRARQSEVKSLESERSRLVDYWKTLSRGATEYPLAKFRVLIEQRKINEEISRMILEAKEEVFALTTSLGVIQKDIAGVLDSMVHLAKKNPKVQFRILADISKENQNVVSRIIKIFVSDNPNMQWRHTDLGSRAYPQFITRDNEETILYVTREEKSPLQSQADTGLLIRSKIFVSALKESFSDIWNNAASAAKRIEQLKTGKPIEETLVIKDAKQAQTKLGEALEKAEKEIIAIMPSTGISTLLNNEFFSNHLNKTSRLRIMAPIDLDNIEPAQKLAESYEVRSVPISYLMMMAIDNQHVFMFRTPSMENPETELPFHFDNVFYTNDARYVERVTEMLGDMWKRGTEVTATGFKTKETEQAFYVSSSDNAMKVIDTMLKNNVSSIVVVEKGAPVGVISEKDLLQKIIKAKRDPEKTTAKQVMSLPVVTIESDQPLTKALIAMRKTGLKQVAVFKKGKFAGILAVKTRQKAR